MNPELGALVCRLRNSQHVSALSARAKRSNLAENPLRVQEIALSPSGLLAMTWPANYEPNLRARILDCTAVQPR